MSTQVRVTFLLEGDDPGHETGVSEDTFMDITSKISNLGGEDIEFEKVHETDPSVRTRDDGPYEVPA